MQQIEYIRNRNTLDTLTMKRLFAFCFAGIVAASPISGNAQSLQTSDPVRTTIQAASGWSPTIDVRTDAVMVYGADSTLPDRLDSWRKRGYITHFMTGIAWGNYRDYFSGTWDGKEHLDEGQTDMDGHIIWHDPGTPYIVPSKNYLEYFKQKKIKPVIDAGVDAIFLEEPEFWARGGYSESFKREWKEYYGFPWRPQDESAENTYLSNKLKYHLYYRALNDVFTYAKEYGKEKGIDVRCYVPTHSLVNYAQWQIVSPEASLASLPCVDGYIAQVWTGTSRAENYYNGTRREHVFETAFLEYGCMESMTAPTGRKMFFLTDPIEDRPRDWEDYKYNYQATFTAQLLYPHMNNYEVLPWPNRIYEGLYNVSADNEEKAPIPRFYSTKMQIMINALNHMPLSDKEVSGSQGISILMANSLMFQRSPSRIQGYEDVYFSNFYGEALPLLMQGIPVHIIHLENVAYPDTWKNTRVLLMTYSNIKPLDSEAHTHLAKWVKNGGTIIYSGRDDDAFQNALEWWNRDGLHYTSPSQHLFSLMGMPQDATEGKYDYGKGHIYVLRRNPKEYVEKQGGDRILLQTIEKAYGKQLQRKNNFQLDRGPYKLIAVLGENPDRTPVELQGSFIDLYDPDLPVLDRKVVQPGDQAFLLDLKKVSHRRIPQILAAASRAEQEKRTSHSYSFVSKAPIHTTNAMRILLPAEPQNIEVIGSEYTKTWDKESKTLLLGFENDPDGVKVSIQW